MPDGCWMRCISRGIMAVSGCASVRDDERALRARARRALAYTCESPTEGRRRPLIDRVIHWPPLGADDDGGALCDYPSTDVASCRGLPS